MYFPRNREFGSALTKLRNFGGGFEPPQTPPRYATGGDCLQGLDAHLIRCEIPEDLYNNKSFENMGKKVIIQNSVLNDVQKKIKFGKRLLTFRV
jgi:hypothetical protein